MPISLPSSRPDRDEPEGERARKGHRGMAHQLRVITVRKRGEIR